MQNPNVQMTIQLTKVHLRYKVNVHNHTYQLQCSTGFICTDNSAKLLTFQYPCDQVKLWVYFGDAIQVYECLALTIKVSELRDFHSGVHNVMLLTGCPDFWASEPTRAENK